MDFATDFLTIWSVVLSQCTSFHYKFPRLNAKCGGFTAAPAASKRRKIFRVWNPFIGEIVPFEQGPEELSPLDGDYWPEGEARLQPASIQSINSMMTLVGW
jgi:hypothetical protein